VSALAVRKQKPFPDHVANQIVGNQLPAGHDRLGCLAEFGPEDYVFPQQVSGRDLRNSVMLHNALGLGAFPGTRWPKQHDGTNRTRGFLRHRLGKSLPISISAALVMEPRGAATSTTHYQILRPRTRPLRGVKPS